MRVLEPHYFAAIKQKKKQRIKKRYVLIVLLAAGLLGGYVVYGQDLLTSTRKHIQQNSSESPATGQEATLEKSKTLKTLTNEQFKALYSSFVYPNTEPISSPPEITGDAAVDARILKIAQARGFKLTAIPVASIVKTDEPGLEGDDLIQPNALIAWQGLKAAADKDGIKLKMTSAYRSIEYQRALLLRRMKDAGVTVYTIAEGFADDELDTVLNRAAPPGYSRHHTGYTMDLSCNGVGLDAFVRTPCYAWLSKDNFAHAKAFGWVPSYPEGVTQNGPEPEVWEYIWVGTNSLYE